MSKNRHNCSKLVATLRSLKGNALECIIERRLSNRPIEIFSSALLPGVTWSLVPLLACRLSSASCGLAWLRPGDSRMSQTRSSRCAFIQRHPGVHAAMLAHMCLCCCCQVPCAQRSMLVLPMLHCAVPAATDEHQLQAFTQLDGYVCSSGCQTQRTRALQSNGLAVLSLAHAHACMHCICICTLDARGCTCAPCPSRTFLPPFEDVSCTLTGSGSLINLAGWLLHPQPLVLSPAHWWSCTQAW